MDHSTSNFTLVALLSDFGNADTYVGVMKGVIARISPTTQTVDLTHAIPPQNVALASFQLGSTWPYFPEGTVYLAVVDPGVGGQRRAIAIQVAAGLLVGPDNGVFSQVLRQSPAIAAVHLTNPQYWRTAQPSTTFHGRDIFAPVAAYLASGVPLRAMGDPIAPADLVCLPPPEWHQDGPRISGAIQAIDHFGNLITTVPGNLLNGNWVVQVGDQQIPSGTTYGSASPGSLVSFVGSHSWLEIAVNSGSAQQALGLRLGDAIQIVLQD